MNYGLDLASVTGNVVRGAGTPRGTGLYYSKGNGISLGVRSTGNAVYDVQTQRFVGTGVTLNSGL